MIIDADFRKPAVYLVLNMKDAEFTSFSDVLKGEKDPDIPLIQVPGTQLHALLNKNASPQSIEMFSSGMIHRIIENCREIMDYIVIDTSPMQLVADAEELGAMVDASVLCVKQHMVEAKDINDASSSTLAT